MVHPVRLSSRCATFCRVFAVTARLGWCCPDAGGSDGYIHSAFSGVGQSGLNADQSVRIAVAFARETAKSPTARLCTACVEVLAVSGAGITLMGGDQAGPICVSDSSIAELEDLQCTIGQGPCRDAYRSGRSVHAPRMDESAFVRWSPFVHLVRST